MAAKKNGAKRVAKKSTAKKASPKKKAAPKKTAPKKAAATEPDAEEVPSNTGTTTIGPAKAIEPVVEPPMRYDVDGGGVPESPDAL